MGFLSDLNRKRKKLENKFVDTITDTIKPRDPKVTYQKLAGIDMAKKEGFTHTNPAITVFEEDAGLGGKPDTAQKERK